MNEGAFLHVNGGVFLKIYFIFHLYFTLHWGIADLHGRGV